MASKYFDDIEVSESDRRFVDKSLAISDRIIALLKQKEMTQRQLAEVLGKRESEISKWLTGTHNFTLRTIAKLEEVLCADILSVNANRASLHNGGTAISRNFYVAVEEKPASAVHEWNKLPMNKIISDESVYAVSA